MNIYYLNHKNEKLDLDSDKIILQYQELYDYSWDTNIVNGKINNFYRKNSTIPITVTVTADTEEEYFRILDEFYRLTEIDILESKPGKIYLGNQYMICYISGSIKKDSFMGVPIQVKNLTLVTDYPFWIGETHYSFLPEQVDVGPRKNEPQIAGDDYPGQPIENNAMVREFQFDFLRPSDRKTKYPLFDMPFDFLRESGRRMIENDSFYPSHFVMTIYGFVDTPTILIGNHPYTINSLIYEGERIVIDSRKGTVKKIGRLGEIEDLYNSREKRYSVFQKIPPGVHTLRWLGTYGVDLTMYDERSEPIWSF